jgi:polygalacturonase
MALTARALLRVSVALIVGWLSATSVLVPARAYVSTSAADAALHTADVLTPEAFGAVGDGVADDTLALQQALDAVTSGGTVSFAEGKVYRHTDVLVAGVPGSHLTGPGVLLATNEERSSFWIAGDNIVVDGGLTFKMGTTTRRWAAWEQMKVRLASVDGVLLRGVNVEGSAAAGIFIGGSSNFLLVDVVVSNTRADGIHMTAGSHDGMLRRPTVLNSGDDGIAVVSYESQGVVCRAITIQSPVVKTTTWGRGLSVVGGEGVTYRNVKVDSSSAAAIYVASEGEPYRTYGTSGVSFLRGKLTRSNTNSQVDHGAVLLNSARAGFSVQGIVLDRISISGTRPEASRQVGVVTYGGTVSNIMLSNLTVDGGGKAFGGNAPSCAYSTVNWWVDGVHADDHWADPC